MLCIGSVALFHVLEIYSVKPPSPQISCTFWIPGPPLQKKICAKLPTLFAANLRTQHTRLVLHV